MIFGITGGSGCGKTTVLRVIRDMGGIVLDCDAIYHELLTTSAILLHSIGDRFPGVVHGGELDRKMLGAIVFADPQALLDLNTLAHGAVKEEVIRRLTPRPKLAAIDAIALFEGGLAELCDCTIAVTAPRENRIARLMAREGISRQYAESRIDAQKTNEEFGAMADIMVDNRHTRQELYEKAQALFEALSARKEDPSTLRSSNHCEDSIDKK